MKLFLLTFMNGLTLAALYFLAVSLVVFFLFGLVYRRLIRHMPAAPRLRFVPSWWR